MLAVGGFYAVSNRAFHDTLALLPENGDSRREKAIDALAEAWSVTSADEATGTLNHLLAGMHAPRIAIVRPLAEAGVAASAQNTWSRLPEQHRAFLREVAELRGMNGLDRDYDNWSQAIKFGFVHLLPRPLNTDATAWDLARIVYVTRASHTAGYLDETTAWDFLARGLAKAQQHYRNWRQFSDGWLTGALFWLSADLAEVDAQIRNRLRMIRGLHVRSGSPWRQVPLHPPGRQCPETASSVPNAWR